MRITGLKTDYQKDPIGIELSDLSFTWQIEEAAGAFAEHTRFMLSADPSFRDLLFDSDRDEADRKGKLPSWCYTPDITVQPAVRYYWKVAVTDDAGDAAESGTAFFEGGHPEGGWTGKWIRPAFSREIHPVMRRSFSISAKEKAELCSARLYVTGLGLYECRLNGVRVGEQFLTPYFTDYRYWLQYQTYDIAGLLREGENTLDIWLGNGWYKGRFGYLANGQLREYYGDTFCLLADLYLNGENGSRVIGTDTDWHCLRSPVVLSGIYDGEAYDARLTDILAAPPAEKLCPVREAEAPKALLCPMLGVPVVQREKRAPEKILMTPAGETVLDFGQEISGWAEFTADVPADHSIVLEYGEVLQNGCFYRDNLRTAAARYEFISSGRKERAAAHFTFFGFRYVRVTGMSSEQVRTADFTAVSLYSDLEETGFITTGNKKVNRLIENTKWSEKDNFVDIPTDCPQRDERCGWTGDAQIFCGAASYHMETPAFFRKYLRDMAWEQREKGGAVPYVVPDVLTIGREKLAEPPFAIEEDGWGEAGSAVWGDAATIIPWTMYLHFGNRRWLDAEYDNMKQWTDFILRMDEEHCGGSRLWTCGFHFGDWLSLDVEGDAAGMNNREGGTDKYFVASVYYMYSAELTAAAAEVLEKTEDAAFYGRLAGEIRRAVTARYVTGPGTLSIRTQTAYALAVHFRLFESGEEMRIAGEQLMQLVHEWKDHLSTGFVGTAYICSALTQTGHGREAFTLLLNEDYPSWLYEVNLGATTIWERWNSLLPDGSISGTGMNSLNHYAYGCIAGWLYESVCGLCIDREGANPGTQDSIGGQSLIIAPHTDERLGSAEASVRFAAGRYTSGWRFSEDGSRISYRFSVPFGGKAGFVPDRICRRFILDGAAVTEEELHGRVFTKGEYLIEGELCQERP
ncbi:family 78 glycoside hydrolase catalytic domain [Lachnoclostridium sp. Marseille-P6806]|uniref:family 78 glycoside hydrolase catalytic domain n=1 Tax=Lachnoclostridium sp. Marseille-P6806 TaxID=2364793 RepID=UPI0013EEFB4C|nr:family 78 glycoside hydrolase catalytic domain [Lachnoclostridium sp. Marseille-P6806]